MTFENLHVLEVYRVTFIIGAHEKQERKNQSFPIPSATNNESVPYAQRFKQYLSKLKIETKVVNSLAAVLCNLLGETGRDVAKYLGIPRWQKYTSYCRSAATPAATNVPWSCKPSLDGQIRRLLKSRTCLYFFWHFQDMSLYGCFMSVLQIHWEQQSPTKQDGRENHRQCCHC